MMQKLEEYPRAVVIQSMDDRFAWVRPFALIGDRYLHYLSDEVVAVFGAEKEILAAKKGAALAVKDTFRYLSRSEQTGKLEIIGDYLPGIDDL